MPNWCYNEIEVEGEDAELLRLVDFVKGEESEFDFNKILPYPAKFAEMDKEVDEKGINHSKGFNSGGYEWCLGNWGTKWNAVEPSVATDGKSISFDTAWSPSIPVTIALSELFPTLKFTHRYEEGGCDFSGYMVIQNGEILEDVSGEYDEYPVTEHDWEDDEEEDDETE